MKRLGLCLAVIVVAAWMGGAGATRPAAATGVPAGCPNTVSPITVPLATSIGHIVVDPACNYVYLTNTTQNRLEIYSLQTLSFEAPIQVGLQPFGFDVTDDGRFAYVANSGGNTISVVDLQNRAETSTFVVPAVGSPPVAQFSPYSLAIANNGKILFSTSNGGAGGLRELNLATSQVSVRSDFDALFGAQTQRMQLRASRDRSTIAIASGNSSIGPVVVYRTATDSVGLKRGLDAFISDVSLDETGSTILVTPWSYVLDPSPRMTGTIIGLPVNAVGVGGSAIDPTRGVGYRSVASHLDVLNMTTFLKIGELSLGSSASTANLNNRIGRMDISDDGTLVAVITNTGFSLVRPLQTAPQTLNLVRNGSFSGGLGNWQTFATPDPSYVQNEVTDGVFQFNRLSPPPGESNQALVFQQTGMALPAGAPLQARFDLGNTSSVRKRISVLLIESDFSDLSVCTFWVPANAQLATYRMRSHTTKAWANASIYFYAATDGAHGGFNQIDNVSLQYDATFAGDRTECVDPTTPAAPGGPDGPDWLVNGDFSTGTPSPWSLFGTLTSQIVGGVFEFARESGTPPAGVILQPTGQSVAANEVVTATFDLGNSSSVRKRVTVLLHDISFGDLSACTFWLAPGQPLAPYTMRTFATQAWSNATISIYAASVGPETWSQLDNVHVRRTPSAAIVGTECIDPAAGTLAAAADSAAPSSAPRRRVATRSAGEPNSDRVSIDHPRRIGSPGETAAVLRAETTPDTRWIDLIDAAVVTLTLESWLQEDDRGEVLVSTDGANWSTIMIVTTRGGWAAIEADLSAYAGQRIALGFRRSGDGLHGPWWVRNIRLVVDRREAPAKIR